jgi:hypothetical protein
VSHLVVVNDPSVRVQERRLTTPVLVLGRGDDVDWVFPNPAVSRHHAAVYHRPDGDQIEDLGSTAGTLVNGSPLSGPRMLRAGDVVQLASVRLRYLGEDDETTARTTGARAPAAAPSFDVDQQRADVISNVGGDQYNSVVQQIIVHREDAYRQIASLSRTARALVIVGFSLAAAGVLSFIGSIVWAGAAATSSGTGGSVEPPEVAGVPVFAVAMGGALIGFACFFLGMVIQFAASTRRREVERRYPLPPGWGNPST